MLCLNVHLSLKCSISLLSWYHMLLLPFSSNCYPSSFVAHLKKKKKLLLVGHFWFHVFSLCGKVVFPHCTEITGYSNILWENVISPEQIFQQILVDTIPTMHEILILIVVAIYHLKKCLIFVSCPSNLFFFLNISLAVPGLSCSTRVL